MARFKLLLCLCLVCACSTLAYPQNDADLAKAAQGSLYHPSVSGDLVQLLSFTALNFHVSVLAELAQPYPVGLRLPEGRHTLTQILDTIIQESPGYAWEKRGSTLLIYNKKLFLAEGNVLNRHLKLFSMPGTLGDLKLELPMNVQVAEGKGGGLITGVKPLSLTAVKLSPELLKNLTVREVLFHAAQQTNIFSLFIFPDDHPARSSDQEAWMNWTLVTSESLETNSLHLRSLPDR